MATTTNQVLCKYTQSHYCHRLNTLRPGQNGRHFADDTFKRIFLNESVRISIKISLKFVPKGPINNIPALVQIMAWRRPGDKPLSETMLVSLPTHICVTRPQWVNTLDLSWLNTKRLGWWLSDKSLLISVYHKRVSFIDIDRISSVSIPTIENTVCHIQRHWLHFYAFSVPWKDNKIRIWPYRWVNAGNT